MRIARRLVCLLVLFPAVAFAQNLRLEERLPPNTSFYLLWRGAAPLEPVRKTNSLLRLWEDPGSAPVRQALSESLYAKAKKEAKGATLTPELMSDLSTLLENPLLAAYVGAPTIPGSSLGSAASAPKDASSAGFIIVYDSTGKTELLQKLRSSLRASSAGQETTTHYFFQGVDVEQVAGPKGSRYHATVANYFLSSENKSVLENFIGRFASAQPPTDSLVKSPDVQRFQREFGSGTVIELFARMPDLSALNIPPRPNFDLAGLVRALHPEKIHSFGMGLSFQEKGTRLHVTLLGDTTSASVLDIAGASDAGFATLAAAPTGAYYSASRIDFSAFYQVFRGALVAALPPAQASRIDFLESQFANQFGMTPGDAFKLLTGEVASITFDPAEDPFAHLYLFSVRDPGSVLRLLRTAFARFLTSDEPEGNTTYLTLAMPYTDPRTRAERRRFYTVAVTPQMVLVAPHKATVREAVARLAAPSGAPVAGSLAADAHFTQARSRLPRKLSGLGYGDLSRMDWPKLFASFTERAAQEDQSGKGAGQIPEWLKQFDPSILSRYLHETVGGWWKDQDGIHFDSDIE